MKKTNYAILRISELENMNSSKIKIKEVTPEIHYALGGHRLSFKCVKRTPAIINIDTGKPAKNSGVVGWYEFYKID